MYGTTLPYLVTDDDREKFRIGGKALTPEKIQEVFELVRADDHDFFIEAFTLTQAIDPTTGDSLLHVAVRAGSMDGVVKLMERFDRARRPRPPRPFYTWAYHAFIAHQNYNGDTVFHVAARNGNLLLMKMIYRYIDPHWSAVCPEDDSDAPEEDVYPITVDEEYSTPRLMLLLTKNRAGRDIIAEARLVGNDGLADWLDAIVDRLDPKRDRRTEEGIAEMTAKVRQWFWYDMMSERQQKQLKSNE
ncbi:ankyrin repeat-containing domain-containing protein [Pochonia chlamydosporia 170]|uniref:Ankyrin repeat-containing domain-containing protein n=1 Tax=Pochonia chlamydosporia 170 TaxID=1380566 RepID=A0A179F8U8_METCM|nr:ankyrin repeat-containing domain-containing protein [Pochonia chlamydosporia 170]OAQ61852.1 ankyrin repeat-containing domain-containing protein [Pochonia chlamydosporia 170]